MLAVASGHSTIVELLLAKGADIKAKYQQDNNVIQVATRFGHDKVLQGLFAKQCDWDLEAQISNGKTALLLAVEYGHSTIVDQLVQKGANPMVKENMSQAAQKLLEKLSSSDHTSTINSVINLISLYISQDRLLEAELLFQQALVRPEKILGPNHKLVQYLLWSIR